MNKAVLAVAIAMLAASAVHAADFATEMMEATFKIKGDATCFLLRREAPDTALYLVTAGHAFSDPKTKTLELVLRKPKPDGSYERIEHTVSLLREGKPLWVRHEKHDVAVLRISDPLPVPVPALPASVLADETKLKAAGVHLCSPLFVLAVSRWIGGGQIRHPNCATRDFCESTAASIRDAPNVPRRLQRVPWRQWRTGFRPGRRSSSAGGRDRFRTALL